MKKKVATQCELHSSSEQRQHNKKKTRGNEMKWTRKTDDDTVAIPDVFLYGSSYLQTGWKIKCKMKKGRKGGFAVGDPWELAKLNHKSH